MSINNFINIYDDFINLDNNSQITYIFTILIILFIINNFIKITSELFISIIITVVIFMIFFYKKNKNIKKDVKIINKINTSLNLNNLKFIMADLDVSLIYYDIIKYKSIDKYSFMNSLVDTNKYLEILNDIKNKNTNYAQLLDIASEKKDSAINHLVAISNSISPNIGINNEDNKIIQNPVENKLIAKIDELRYIFEKYWFEMLDNSRLIYETSPININSKPIVYDINSPNPNAKQDVFNVIYGQVN